MDLVQSSFMIYGVSPILYNRKDLILEDSPLFKKQRGEDYMVVENRIWKEKAHYLKITCNSNDPEERELKNANDIIVVPAQWLKMSLVNTQKQSAFPIKPAGARRSNDTMKQFFIAGVLFDENIELMDAKGKNPITRKDLAQHKCVVTVPKGGSIPCVRPMIQSWSSEIRYTILDKAINKKIIEDCFEYIGIYFGLGDWRPQHGGMFGRFSMKPLQ